MSEPGEKLNENPPSGVDPTEPGHAEQIRQLIKNWIEDLHKHGYEDYVVTPPQQREEFLFRELLTVIEDITKCDLTYRENEAFLEFIKRLHYYYGLKGKRHSWQTSKPTQYSCQ